MPEDNEHELFQSLPASAEAARIVEQGAILNTQALTETDPYKKRLYEQQKQRAHAKGIEDHYRHRSWWSLFLMGLMLGMVVFQSLLLGMVGAGLWDLRVLT